MSALGFAYTGGVHVLGTSIWCDAARARGTSFLSRADATVAAGVGARRHRIAQAISSERTASLRRALGWPGGDALVPRFGRPFALGRARLELLPAGGMPGASQLLVELAGWRGLYAGELARSVGGEALQVRACDEVVVDAPEAGGFVDAREAIEAAAHAGGSLVFEDLLALFGLAALLGREGVAPPARWSRALSPSTAALGTSTKSSRVVLRAARPGSGGRRVLAGQRAADRDDALALGLGLDADALVRVIADCGARRVHVRLADPRDPLRAAGARALIARLRAMKIEARPMGPAEQLTLI